MFSWTFNFNYIFKCIRTITTFRKPKLHLMSNGKSRETIFIAESISWYCFIVENVQCDTNNCARNECTYKVILFDFNPRNPSKVVIENCHLFMKIVQINYDTWNSVTYEWNCVIDMLLAGVPSRKKKILQICSPI